MRRAFGRDTPRRMRLPRLAICAALFLAGPATAAEPRADGAARIAWGFEAGGVEPHPEVRFGLLGNGMKYALMHNAVPRGGLAARLRIAAGAGDEGPREEGFLHLVEHMIFHGSETLPEGSLPLFLSTQGLRRWSDFNAYTDYAETVFRLDLAKADAPAVETSLRLMREIAGRLAFTRDGVSGAKDVVRDEIAGRDALADPIAAAEAAFLMPGAPAARGPVAGSAGDVRRATPERLRRLYDLFYRPERATLVLVGDLDVEAAEAELRKQFADWSARGEAQAPPPVWLPPRRGVEARLFVDRAAPTAVTITSVRPVAAAADSDSGRDGAYLEHLAAEMLARRLRAAAAEAGAPFARPAAHVYDHHRTARLSQIELAVPGRDWQAALQRASRELRRALEEGFSEAELEAQLAQVGKAPAAAAPRSSAAIADAIVDSVHRGYVFSRPADPAATAAYHAAVRIEDVNAALRAAWSDPSRLIFLTHNRRIKGGEQEVSAAWTKAH